MPKERGQDYNHSTCNDLIITGLVGLRPRIDDVVEAILCFPPEPGIGSAWTVSGTTTAH